MLAEDPLSQWLSLLDASAVLSARLRAQGRWSVRIDTDGPKVNAVTRGHCWLVHAELGDALELSQGDAFVLMQPGSYVLCSDRTLLPMEAHDVFSGPEGWCDGGEGPPFEAIGCRIDINSEGHELLRRTLPAIVHVDARSTSASAVRWLIERLGLESSVAGDGRGGTSSTPGAFASADLMARLLFVETIRYWATLPDSAAGALGASKDPRLTTVLLRLHADPAHPWKLGELADLAGMSRSAFAQHFRASVGRAPLDYLIHWRLRLAARLLRSQRSSLTAIAEQVGYQSDSALSQAFKRVHGLSPAEYRRATREERTHADLP